jgi:hypothetical protein
LYFKLKITDFFGKAVSFFIDRPFQPSAPMELLKAFPRLHEEDKNASRIIGIYISFMAYASLNKAA